MPLRAPIKCFPCRYLFNLPNLPEDTVLTLIKVIIIAIAVILSILLFGRFLF